MRLTQLTTAACPNCGERKLIIGTSARSRKWRECTNCGQMETLEGPRDEMPQSMPAGVVW